MECDVTTNIMSLLYDQECSTAEIIIAVKHTTPTGRGSA